MIGKTIHNFRIVAELGKGGMGVVYLAEHIKFPKKFAIKSLAKSLSDDPQFRQRFFDESKTQALLDHPNIVQVTDCIEAEGQFFIVMEYVDGEDLGKMIRSRGKLPVAEALRIFQDVLSGMAFAHSKGVIHRDIKPSNMLVDGHGRARIMDFGIAILAGSGRRLTATGAPIGSPWYMSPEQIERPRQLDKRTDIYSLGIVLFEMLAGNVPFDGETGFAVQEKQVHAPIPDLHQLQPDVSTELAEIVRRAMAKNPAERFQDCAEFLERIREFDRTQLGTETRRNIRPVMVGAVAAALILSAGMVFISRPVTQQPPPDHTSQREIAYNLIQTGAEKALTICRDLERVRLKKDGLLAVSSDAIDSASIDKLKKQIGDIEKNIDDAIATYGGLVSQLSGLKSDVVDTEFERYTQLLAHKSSFPQIPAIRMLKHHAVGKRQGSLAPDITALSRECAEARMGMS